MTGDLLITDLGIDAVVFYSLGTDGRLTEKSRIFLTPGSGPRHAAFHPDGRHLFVVTELDSTLVVFRRAGDGFLPIWSISTLPSEFDGHNQAGALRISATGDFVYVSNRGHDSIAVFSFDTAGEFAEPIQFESTRGRTPRDFLFSPDGTLVHVANQDSNSIVTFHRDASGRLTFRDVVEMPTPVCLSIVGS